MLTFNNPIYQDHREERSKVFTLVLESLLKSIQDYDSSQEIDGHNVLLLSLVFPNAAQKHDEILSYLIAMLDTENASDEALESLSDEDRELLDEGFSPEDIFELEDGNNAISIKTQTLRDLLEL